MPDPSPRDALLGISSMATRALLAVLARGFAQAGSGEVAFESVGGVLAAKRVRAGEAFDLVVLAADALAALEGEGRVLPGTRRPFALSPMAMAVRAGVTPPAIADADALRLAVLRAARIGCSTGPSGDHLKRLGEAWGIAAELEARLVQASPGQPVAALLARGEAEIGFQQLSELQGAPGIDLVGRLPSGLGTDTVFAAGLASTSGRRDAATAFLAYLATPGAAGLVAASGMDPV